MISRIVERSLKRRPPAGPTLPYLWWHYVANGRRTLQARAHRFVYGDTRGIARQIVEDGITFGPSHQYLSEEGQGALAEVTPLVLDIAHSGSVQTRIASGKPNQRKDYIVHLIPWESEHDVNSPLVRLGLDQKLLEVVSAYLGLCPRLHAIGAWLNYPTEGEAKEAQLWHRDPEDAQVVKVFIYLVDVDENCGPFCYIPKTQPLGALAAKVPDQKGGIRAFDADVCEVLPAETWRICTGPKNTMIIADTVGYHRGGKPINGNRILITFTYASGSPFKGKGRRFRVKGSPEWMMSGIQRSAL